MFLRDIEGQETDLLRGYLMQVLLALQFQKKPQATTNSTQDRASLEKYS